MDKRYQVFVSSTYSDLQEERKQIMQTLMEMDCIPAGMELFPAADEEQLDFIKRIIDDCDYYLLIIGGRYGSMTAEGISYTEKEYDYAVEKGIKVIALIHENPNKLPNEKSDTHPEIKEKLDKFRKKVQDGRLVKLWNNSNELSGIVSLSLNKAIKTYPAVGWVRATEGDQSELLKQINQLKHENNLLKQQLEPFLKLSTEEYKNLSQGKDSINIVINKVTYNISWDELLLLIGPDLRDHQHENNVSHKIVSYILRQNNKVVGGFERLDIKYFNIIQVQFLALGYIKIERLKTNGGSIDPFWILTKVGEQALIRNVSLKRQ